MDPLKMCFLLKWGYSIAMFLYQRVPKNGGVFSWESCGVFFGRCWWMFLHCICWVYNRWGSVVCCSDLFECIKLNVLCSLRFTILTWCLENALFSRPSCFGRYQGDEDQRFLNKYTLQVELPKIPQEMMLQKDKFPKWFILSLGGQVTFK